MLQEKPWCSLKADSCESWSFLPKERRHGQSPIKTKHLRRTSCFQNMLCYVIADVSVGDDKDFVLLDQFLIWFWL